MGLYDRDYGRDDDLSPWERQQRSQSQTPKSMTVILIIITVAIYLIDMVSAERVVNETPVSRLAPFFAVHKETLVKPWLWFQFLTYGFLHAQESLFHIGFNMLNLFVFGRMVEIRLGRWEFLRFYLVSMIVGGIVGSATYWATGSAMQSSVIGASGAVSAVIIIFALQDPQAVLLLMGALPIKAWVLAAAFLAINIFGSMSMLRADQGAMQGSTAYTVHLAGALFAYLYFSRRWRLDWLNVAGLGNRVERSVRKTKLKIHDPDANDRKEQEDVDRILGKIHASGEESLTRSERRILERYSRRQREKRNQK